MRASAQIGNLGSGRDLRLDALRGLALMLIFLDHIPENWIGTLTLRNVAFSDAAEMFIFLSGYASGLVFGMAYDRAGALFAGARTLRRVWQLYLIHILVFVLFSAQVSWSAARFNNPLFLDEMNVTSFLSEPHVAVFNALLLRFQPTFLDILPLYIVLLLFFPLALALMRVHLAAALVPSFLLWLAVQRFGWAPTTYPDGTPWSFNPLAWQFLFLLGAAASRARSTGRSLLPRHRALAMAAAAIIIVSAVIRGSWTLALYVPALPPLLATTLLPLISKSNLAWPRLLDFLALAYLFAYLVPRDHPLLRKPGVRWLVRLGQHSLAVFCLSIFLAYFGHLALVELAAGPLAQLAVSLIGAAALLAWASLMHWYRRLDREAPA